MHAIPPNLSSGAGDQHTGLICPDCNGSISARAQGVRGHVVFSCRVGHAYGVEDFITGKEEQLEACLWRAVYAYEELSALLSDLDAHYSEHQGKPVARYQDRIAAAGNQARVLRNIIQHDQPIRLQSDENSDREL
jgi:two-component system, chemotaxis family, protein-glutamate methylesterase/glutaminase